MARIQQESSFDRLVRALQDRKAKAAIKQVFEHATKQAELLDSHPPGGFVFTNARNAHFWLRRYSMLATFSLRDCLTQHVMRPLGPFPPITVEELANAACLHLAGFEGDEHYERGYRRLLADLHHRIQPRESSPRSVCDHERVDRLPLPSEPIYRSPDGLEIQLGLHQINGTPAITACLQAISTELAFELAERWIVPAVELIIRYCFDNRIVFDKNLDDRIETHLDSGEDLPTDLEEEERAAYVSGWRRSQLCIRLFLEQDPDQGKRGKDKPYNSMRIHNAIRLAVEAQR
jgi:hypothetical protein